METGASIFQVASLFTSAESTEVFSYNNRKKNEVPTGAKNNLQTSFWNILSIQFKGNSTSLLLTDSNIKIDFWIRHGCVEASCELGWSEHFFFLKRIDQTKHFVAYFLR